MNDTTAKRALLIVDVQNDFVEGGALGVQGGNAVAEKIGKWLSEYPFGAYDYIAASLDWHKPLPDTNAGHFNTWPVHCVEGTTGAALHPAVGEWTSQMDALVRKGRGCQSYSAFEGVTWDGQRTLIADLRTAGIRDLDVCGIATDHCVLASVQDALGLGLRARVLTEMCAAVDPDGVDAVLAQMKAEGAEIL